jgi:hypothetical protein
LTTQGGNADFSAVVGGALIAFGPRFTAIEFCAPLTLSVPGSASGVLPTGVCDVLGRPAAVHRFTKSATGGLAVVTTSAFRPRIEVKTGRGDDNIAFETPPGASTIEWLLPPGEFLYRIATQTVNGSYSVAAANVAGTSGTATRAIVASGTFGGQSLSANDRQFGDNTLYDYYILFSNRPCTITMRSTAFDAFLWIDDAVDLFFIDGDDNSGGGNDARVEMATCNYQGNPIGIMANSNLGPGMTAAFGQYALTVEFGLAQPLLRQRRDNVAVIPGGTARDLSAFIRMRDSIRVQR